MNNSGITSRRPSRQVHLESKLLFQYYALDEQDDQKPPCGIMAPTLSTPTPSRHKHGTRLHQSHRPSFKNDTTAFPKAPTDSSPTKTERTRTTEFSSSCFSASPSCDSFSCTTNDSTTSGSSVFYESSSSSSSSSSSYSSSASYICLEDISVGEDGSLFQSQAPSSSPAMTPQEMIKVLEEVNHDDDANSNDNALPPTTGFFSRERAPPPLMIEELTDLLCHVNTNEKAQVEIEWDTVYNVVHRQTETDDDKLPFHQLEVPNDDDDDISTTSSLSMESCIRHHHKSLVDSLVLDPIDDR